MEMKKWLKWCWINQMLPKHHQPSQLLRLQRKLQCHPNRHKVWNLHLSHMRVQWPVTLWANYTIKIDSPVKQPVEAETHFQGQGQIFLQEWVGDNLRWTFRHHLLEAARATIMEIHMLKLVLLRWLKRIRGKCWFSLTICMLTRMLVIRNLATMQSPDNISTDEFLF